VTGWSLAALGSGISAGDGHQSAAVAGTGR